jgi:RNA polymerase sigma-70 factor (ECF subfamily)
MESPERRKDPVDPDEAGLIVAAQGGDAAAFGRLVKLHQRSIYRVAYGITRNASDADDLAQETFVRAFQAIGRFRVGEPLHPWLARIAVNLAFSLYRRRKRRPEMSLEPLLEAGQQFAGADDPAENVAKRERDRHLAAAFAELSEEHRAILVLRVVEEMSYEEIARALRLPPGTVMSRLSRARADLKTRLRARTGENP